MNKPALTCLLLCLLTMTALFSLRCDDAESSDDTVNSLAVASSAVSECGGFGTSDMALTDEDALLEYCDAEILTWSYDKETAVLSLLNTRVMLNCCGDHGFTTELTADGVYVVTETDRPMKTSEGSYDRCNCMCAFDYEIELENIPSASISFTLLRAVEEELEVQTVWEGSLDLSASSTDNTIVTNEEAASFGCSASSEE